MDTVTQALLGAVVGQTGFSHRLGRRALVWGAVGGLIPDLDVVAIATRGPFAEFLYHRGCTHALWFGPVVGPILGWAIWRGYRWRGRDGPGDPGDPSLLRAWMGLLTLALITHPLIDVFTTYGTQLFAPFWRERFALNAVGIVDFVYSGILILALGVAILFRHRIRAIRIAGALALVLSWTYMGYGWWLNHEAETTIERKLVASGHPEVVVRAYPTFLQPFLRRVVARVGDRIRVGLYTPLSADGMHWEEFKATPPHPLIEKLKATPRGDLFVWFAMGEISARVSEGPDGTTVEIDDLRYGFPGTPERGMWGIRGRFDHEQRLIEPVQRIRHPRPSRTSIEALWQAMWGNFSKLP
jgi:inner membrane protein